LAGIKVQLNAAYIFTLDEISDLPWVKVDIADTTFIFSLI